VYARSAFNQLPKTKFHNLSEFLDMFCNQASQHYKDSVVAKRLSTYLSGDAKRVSNTYEESESEDDSQNGTPSISSGGQRYPVRSPPDPPHVVGRQG
jgi:hypothetical protein